MKDLKNVALSDLPNNIARQIQLSKNPRINGHARVNLLNVYRLFKCEPEGLKHHNSLWVKAQDANLETAVNWIGRHNSLVNSFVCNTMESIETVCKDYEFNERETCINIFTPLNLGVNDL